MADMLAVKPVTLIGKAYVREAPVGSPDCFLCIDSEETKGIVFGFFDKENIENARLAAKALNLWAGFDEDEQMRPTLIVAN